MLNVVFDTVTLLNLADGNVVDAVAGLYGASAGIPDTVVIEIQHGAYQQYPNAILCLKSLNQTPSWPLIYTLDWQINPQYQQLQRIVGKGEAAAITLASIHRATVATDDRKARQAAQQLGLQITGSVGILVRLVNQQMMPLAQANTVLQLMREAGFFSPIQNIDHLISAQGE